MAPRTPKPRTAKVRAEHLGKPGIRRLMRRAGGTSEQQNAYVAVRAHTDELTTRVVDYCVSLLNIGRRSDDGGKTWVRNRLTISERMVKLAFEAVVPGSAIVSGNN